jgi:hypothetical protein
VLERLGTLPRWQIIQPGLTVETQVKNTYVRRSHYGRRDSSAYRLGLNLTVETTPYSDLQKSACALRRGCRLAGRQMTEDNPRRDHRSMIVILSIGTI